MTLYRAETMAALRTGFAAALLASSDAAEVIRDPDRERPREFVAVFAANTDGEATPAAVRAGGSLEDVWEIRVVVASDLPGSTWDEAEARVEVIANIVIDWLLANANAGVTHLRNVRLSAAAGPLLGAFSNQEHGYGASYHLTLTATSRRC